jgi:hypothetical protein
MSGLIEREFPLTSHPSGTSYSELKGLSDRGQTPATGVFFMVNTSDTVQRLARLRAEFNRLKAPDAYELAMSAEELKKLLAEIRAEGRALIEQLQALAKSGKEAGLVTEITGRLERTLGRLKAQDNN